MGYSIILILNTKNSNKFKTRSKLFRLFVINTPFPLSNKLKIEIEIEMIEVFPFEIVLGLIPIPLAWLFVTAYLQYRRGDQI